MTPAKRAENLLEIKLHRRGWDYHDLIAVMNEPNKYLAEGAFLVLNRMVDENFDYRQMEKFMRYLPNKTRPHNRQLCVKINRILREAAREDYLYRQQLWSEPYGGII